MTVPSLAPVIPSSVVPAGRQRARAAEARRCRWPARSPCPQFQMTWSTGSAALTPPAGSPTGLVRPGESRGRYICELLVSLPDSSA
jgi:hypothetical protein